MMNKRGIKGDDSKKGNGGKGGGSGKGNPAVAVANGGGVKGGGKGGSFTENEWKGMGYHKFVRSLPKAAEYNWRRCSCEFLNAPNRLPPHNPSRVCNAFKGVPTNRICDKLLSKCVPCNSSGEPKPDVPGSPPAKKTTKRKKQRQNQAAKRTDGAWNVAGAEEGDDSDEEKFEIDDGEDPEETERKSRQHFSQGGASWTRLSRRLGSMRARQCLPRAPKMTTCQLMKMLSIRPTGGRHTWRGSRKSTKRGRPF